MCAPGAVQYLTEIFLHWPATHGDTSLPTLSLSLCVSLFVVETSTWQAYHVSRSKSHIVLMHTLCLNECSCSLINTNSHPNHLPRKAPEGDLSSAREPALSQSGWYYFRNFWQFLFFLCVEESLRIYSTGFQLDYAVISFI